MRAIVPRSEVFRNAGLLCLHPPTANLDWTRDTPSVSGMSSLRSLLGQTKATPECTYRLQLLDVQMIGPATEFVLLSNGTHMFWALAREDLVWTFRDVEEERLQTLIGACVEVCLFSVHCRTTQIRMAICKRMCVVFSGYCKNLWDKVVVLGHPVFSIVPSWDTLNKPWIHSTWFRKSVEVICRIVSRTSPNPDAHLIVTDESRDECNNLRLFPVYAAPDVLRRGGLDLDAKHLAVLACEIDILRNEQQEIYGRCTFLSVIANVHDPPIAEKICLDSIPGPKHADTSVLLNTLRGISDPLQDPFYIHVLQSLTIHEMARVGLASWSTMTVVVKLLAPEAPPDFRLKLPLRCIWARQAALAALKMGRVLMWTPRQDWNRLALAGVSNFQTITTLLDDLVGVGDTALPVDSAMDDMELPVDSAMDDMEEDDIFSIRMTREQIHRDVMARSFVILQSTPIASPMTFDYTATMMEKLVDKIESASTSLFEPRNPRLIQRAYTSFTRNILFKAPITCGFLKMVERMVNTQDGINIESSLAGVTSDEVLTATLLTTDAMFLSTSILYAFRGYEVSGGTRWEAHQILKDCLSGVHPYFKDKVTIYLEDDEAMIPVMITESDLEKISNYQRMIHVNRLLHLRPHNAARIDTDTSIFGPGPVVVDLQLRKPHVLRNSDKSGAYRIVTFEAVFVQVRSSLSRDHALFRRSMFCKPMVLTSAFLRTRHESSLFND